MSRPRGFTNSWRPQAKTLALIDHVKAVLSEYHDLLPLTVRQVFYRLVVQIDFAKTEQAYARLCETLSRARRSRMIPMDAIRDDGFSISQLEVFTDSSDVIAAYQRHASTVRLDRQRGQSKRLLVWCEAQGMVPMLEKVALRYGVPVASSGGFDSLTAKHDMAKQFAQNEKTTVLHLGDYDPSGVHMYSSLAEDIEAFARSMGGFVSFERIAVTAAQRDQYNLPTAPPKKTDRRAFSDASTVQCEALPPDVLLQLIETSICDRMDLATWRSTLREEGILQASVIAKLGAAV